MADFITSFINDVTRSESTIREDHLNIPYTQELIPTRTAGGEAF